MRHEVDLGNEAGGGDDDDDRGDEVASGETEDEGVTKLATPSVQDVGKDDGDAADQGETADDHVDIVAVVPTLSRWKVSVSLLTRTEGSARSVRHTSSL